MIRTLLAGLLATALLLVPNLSASDTQSGSELVRGTAEGHWQLPTDHHDGRVIGLLVTIDEKAFVLNARLAPPQLVGDRWLGRMEGVLHAVRGHHDAGRPVLRVQGRYRIGQDGNGRFEAGFLPLPSETAITTQRVGRIWGLFHDEPDARHAAPGSFIGRWVMRRPAPAR